MASTASAVTSAASTNMTSNEQPTATLAKSSSILQELCSRPKNYGANPTTTGGTASMEMAATASSEAEKQPLQSPAAPVATVLPQPESPGLKMKIKRSNSTNSKDSAEDKNETESRPKKSSNSKRKKDMAAAPTSSSSTSSSRSSSPRSSASPISQLPPFLLAAMTAGANGPRLDALLRQMSHSGGPPSKKPKLNGDCSNGSSIESDESSPSSVASPLTGNTSGGSEVATMTEPESLGNCEPGTAVKLQGIVWQETDKGGLLMLNVNWKGKTYVGTLLDCHIPLEEHKWGPPGEVLADKARGKRGGRCSRSRTPPVRIPIRKSNKAVNHKNNARAKLFSMPVSPLAKDNVKENGHTSKNRKHFNENDETTAEESDMTNKDEDSDENNPAEPDTLSPTSRLIECPKPDCAKKFRDLNALKYHLSYAHNDLKKAAAIVAEKRQKILKSNNNKSNSKSSDASAALNNNKGHIKKEVKQEVKLENGAVKQTNSEVVKSEVKPPIVTQPPSSVKSEAAVVPETPLDLASQKRPVSPAYSDISDEDEPMPVASVNSSLPKTQPLPASNLTNIPSLNNLKMAAVASAASSIVSKPPQQPPPPAHSNSLKKPLSLEETLKKPPQFMPPGFPPGFPGLPAGLPAHLAAAVASGRYPPGFMPVAPPGFPSPAQAARGSPFMHQAPPAGSSSASQKLQELQDRVMASTRPPSMHLGQAPPPPGAHGSLGPSSSSAASFSSLARELLPPAHFNSLSRMAGSLNAAGLLQGTKHLFPPK